MRSYFATWLASSLALFSIPSGAEQDLEGSADHPLIRRYPGSVIARYRQHQFHDFEIPLGPAKDDDQFTKSKRVEGKITAILYKNPQGPLNFRGLQEL